MLCYCNYDKKRNDKIVKRGDMFYADLGLVMGSEQGGIRPVIIIQNDVGNKYSPTVIVATITSKLNKAKLPTHILISKKYGLKEDSIVLLEQIRTLDKSRLKEKIGHADRYLLNKIDDALLTSVGISTNKEMNINKQINNRIKEEQRHDEEIVREMSKYINDQLNQRLNINNSSKKRDCSTDDYGIYSMIKSAYSIAHKQNRQRLLCLI